MFFLIISSILHADWRDDWAEAVEEYQDALNDVNKAIVNPNLSKNELTRALVTRIAAKSNLGITEGVLEDLTSFNDSLPASPTIEFTKKHIIMRNVLECECYKKIMINFFIKSGYCESESEIKMLNSGIWIIDKKEKNNYEYEIPVLLLECGDLSPLSKASTCRCLKNNSTNRAI